jgi:hypothetical protein
MSKTIVRPSGETSSDIHVPSSVEKSIVRAGSSGRSPFFGFDESAAAGVCAPATVADEWTAGATSSAAAARSSL